MNKTQIFKSYEEFSKREDVDLNGVSEEFAEKIQILKGEMRQMLGVGIALIARIAKNASFVLSARIMLAAKFAMGASDANGA